MERLEKLSNEMRNNTVNMDLGLIWTQKTETGFDFEQNVGNLKGKTIVISGASRGIGLAIGVRCAKDGANIVILAKTTEAHPKLPGTIFSAAKEIEQAGGQALAIQCDIRSEEQVKEAVKKVIDKFNRIDILVNNASAIALLSTQDLPIKRYDLIHQINIRGTFLLTKYCLPYLKQSANAHILTISPPLNLEQKWFKDYPAYSVGKFGMSLLSFGWAAEFKPFNIAVNCLWPRTAIATMAVQNEIGGDAMMKLSRNVNIMADSAYQILISNAKTTNGQFFIDDFVLRSLGYNDLKKYQCDPNAKEYELIPDFFC